jgi:hypothetical protein
MAKARQVHKVSLDDEAVKEILAALLQEFRQRGFGTAELHKSYQGMSPTQLKQLCCDGGAVSDVDFDLAMSDLDKGGLVKTGPMKAYENTPGSSVVIIALYSKNEYAYLTEDGYKAASKVRPARPPRVPMPTVHISGGTFHQSPIGVGKQVQQTIQVSAGSDELFGRLKDEIVKHVADEQKRSAALVHLEKLEAAPDRQTKIEVYNKLVGSIADHITIFGPLLPLLLQQIMS